MVRSASLRLRRGLAGQTLVIALIVMGVLLLLGFVFIGIIAHNINNTGRYAKRSVSDDLAEAGVRFVHAQMLDGTLGADWRGLPTPPTARLDLGPNLTSDPDAMYTRMGSGLPFRGDDPTQVDLGGPDGLGFYTRVNFAGGRALVRVRYSPSDANVFSSPPTGGLRNPGKAKSYVIIESVGRQGIVNPNDPTTLNASPTQFQGFATAADLQTGMSALADTEKSYPTSRKEIAFVSIGIIDDALYVTNQDRVSRPMEIGFPSELDVTSVSPNGAGGYGVVPVAVPQVFGGFSPMFNFGAPPTPAGNIPDGGSMTINGDLIVHGDLRSYINASMGESIDVGGVVTPADDNARLDLFRAEYEGARPGFAAGWYGAFPPTSPIGTVVTLTQNSLMSRKDFYTVGDAIRDGIGEVDKNGFPREAAYKDPPSMEQRDPATGTLRYVSLTRDSGGASGAGDSGRFGHGSGVYVDNDDDVQIPRDDLSRALVGSQESLPYDWLNPNNGTNPNSGWQGPYYTPIAAFVLLQPDGFVIVRDAPKGNLDHAFWKEPDGTQTGLTSLRYRVGLGSDGQVHVVNALTAGIPDIGAKLAKTDYMKGPVFNGVLYFEGNVRVRGVVPTDVQLTLVSNATIYIEGSIVRGVVGSDVALDQPAGKLLARPSRSAIMLMARDYVALNTTQFFGPGTSGGFDSANSLSAPDGLFPIRESSVGGSFSLLKEFLLDPNSGGAVDPYNPSTWLPYDGNYFPPGSTTPLPTELLLTHAEDTGTGAEAFLSMDVNAGLPGAPYQFPLTANNGALAILGAGYTEPGYTNPGFAPVYGLGGESWQQFAQFETIGFPLVTQNFAYSAATASLTGLPANVGGVYTLIEEATDDFTFRLNQLGGQPASAYLLGRAAVVPSDIRIEASIYAEEGSFFVIPGQWFDPNPNDTRLAFLDKVQEGLNNGMTQAQAGAAADLWRLNNFGAYPEAPFYAEPIDAKITIFGSVSENVTPPISQQGEWLKKWGWIPIQQGSPTLGIQIPASHQVGAAPNAGYAPNLSIIYDPTLATGRVEGYAPSNGGATDVYLRTDAYGRPLAPMPRLPVSGTLAYFGEEQF